MREEGRTSDLWIVSDCSLNTNHFGLHNQLAKPSSLMLTIPLRTTPELNAMPEFGLTGDAPTPE
jgi:hypothetical protein